MIRRFTLLIVLALSSQVLGWLLIMPGARKHRGLAVLGGLIVTAGMLSIVQARY